MFILPSIRPSIYYSCLDFKQIFDWVKFLHKGLTLLEQDYLIFITMNLIMIANKTRDISTVVNIKVSKINTIYRQFELTKIRLSEKRKYIYKFQFRLEDALSWTWYSHIAMHNQQSLSWNHIWPSMKIF